MINDLDLIIDDVAKRHAVPLVLFGHSMGSFIAQQYAILHGNKLKGLILSGSNYQSPTMYKLVSIASKIEKMRIGARLPSSFLDFLSFGSFNSKLKPVRTTSDWLSRDPVQVDKYINDSYCVLPC